MADTSEAADVALERVLGTNDMLGVNYLALAAAAARAVGRIRIRKPNGRTAGWGTGFLVSAGGLLLTNNHVVPAPAIAAASLIDFQYEDGADGQPLVPQTFALDPERFFLTDKKLDFSLVAVAPRSQAGDERAALGWCHLIEELGKVLVGELVNIIQHPGGERKQIALRQNEVIDLHDRFIHYRTDTNPGSSGAPVFNDQWEVVALHHTGVPQRDEKGRVLTRDGRVWDKAEGDDVIAWRANEGVRVSSILQAVRDGTPVGTAVAELREQLLATGPRPAVGEATGPVARPAHPRPIDSAGRMSQEAGAFTVHVDVSVVPASAEGAVARLDTSRRSGAGPRSAIAPSQPEVAAALAELEAARSRPYNDAAADREAQGRYYHALTLGTDRGANFARVSQLVTATHERVHAYSPARHLYPWVDLQPNGMLRSIYSTREFAPEDLIQEDFEIERLEAERREQLMAESLLRPETMEAMLEAAAPFNCEHVVPQSWFGKREPMRGDLHHLFTCEWGCNSFRGNTPFFDYPDFEEKVRDQCGRRETDRFEPSAGKGEVARATLFFLLRYPGEIGDAERELQYERLPIMLAWHGRFPPTEHERHRNQAIAQKQGNRNPLVDRPEIASEIDFGEGFADGRTPTAQ